MTVSLNEIANLVTQIESIKDDSDNTVICVSIAMASTYILLESSCFLSEFVDFNIICVKDIERKRPYELKASILGVEFATLMSSEEIVDLKITMPNQWEYIQQTLQMDHD